MYKSDFFDKNIFLNNYSVIIYPNCYNAFFLNGFEMDMHKHERAEIMYVRKGHATVLLKDTSISLESGSYILINAFTYHSLKVAKKSGTQIIMFEFIFSTKSNKFVNGQNIYKSSKFIKSFVESKKTYFKSKDTGNILNILNNLLDVYEKGSSTDNFMLQALFFEMYEYIAQSYYESIQITSFSTKKYIYSAKAYINKNFTFDISIDDIAKHVNLNKSYLSKIFKSIEGITIFEYITLKRIERSKLLLKKAELAIMDVALYSGFNSRQYFTNLFKKHTGFTPTEYRNKSLFENAPY